MHTAEEKEDNVIPFARPKTGGGLPPVGNNWIKELPEGCRFLAQHKNNANSLLMEFFLGSDPKVDKAVFLGYEQQGGFGFRWHDPVRFCQEFTYFDTLPDIEIRNGSFTVQQGTVEGDGKPEVVDPVHD